MSQFTPFTLAQLRDRVRKRSDMDGDFRTDDEVDEVINAAWGRLYDLLVTTFESFFIEQYDLTLSAETDVYSLAAVDPRVYKILGVDLVLSSATGDTAPIPRFQWSERGRFAGAPDFARRRTGTALRYAYVGDALRFVPVPSGERNVRVYYVPQLEPLREADPDATPDPIVAVDLPDVVQPGWEDFIVYDAAIALLQDEESDTSAIERKLADIRTQIEGSAPARDAENPPRMIRRAGFDDGPNGTGGYGGGGGWGDY